MATHGIDFMAIARGAELANELNWKDEQRAFERDKMAFARDELMDKARERDWRRRAAAYSAPIISNWQRATAAGVAPDEFIQQQMQQIHADPGFQRLAPEAQGAVQEQLLQSAKGIIGTLHNTGQLDRASALARAVGFVDPVNPVVASMRSGDVQTGIDAVNQHYGANLALNDDGTVTINGVKVPAHDALLDIARAQSASGAYARLTPLQQAAEYRELQRQALENQRAATAAAAAQQAQIMNAAVNGVPDGKGGWLLPPPGYTQPAAPSALQQAQEMMGPPANLAVFDPMAPPGSDASAGVSGQYGMLVGVPAAAAAEGAQSVPAQQAQAAAIPAAPPAALAQAAQQVAQNNGLPQPVADAARHAGSIFSGSMDDFAARYQGHPEVVQADLAQIDEQLAYLDAQPGNPYNRARADQLRAIRNTIEIAAQPTPAGWLPRLSRTTQLREATNAIGEANLAMHQAAPSMVLMNRLLQGGEAEFERVMQESPEAVDQLIVDLRASTDETMLLLADKLEQLKGQQ